MRRCLKGNIVLCVQMLFRMFRKKDKQELVKAGGKMLKPKLEQLLNMNLYQVLMLTCQDREGKKPKLSECKWRI